MKERGESIIQLEGDVFGDKILMETLHQPTNSAGRLLKVNFMIRIKLMSYLRRETHKRSRATHNGRVGGLIVRSQSWVAGPGCSLDKLVRKGGGGGAGGAWSLKAFINSQEAKHKARAD